MLLPGLGAGRSFSKWTGLQWWTPDVTSWGHGWGLGRRVPCLMLGGPSLKSWGKGAGARGPCTVLSNAPWVIVTWGSPRGQNGWQTDRHDSETEKRMVIRLTRYSEPWFYYWSGTKDVRPRPEVSPEGNTVPCRDRPRKIWEIFDFGK